MPEAPQKSNDLGAKYVSQAVPSLVTMLKITPEDVTQIQVWIAGGANMFEKTVSRKLPNIGFQNIEYAKRLLTQLGFVIRELDIGGDQGRKIILDCNSGMVAFSKFVKSP